MGVATAETVHLRELSPSDGDFLAALHLAVTGQRHRPGGISPLVEDLLESEKLARVKLRPLIAAYAGGRLEFAVGGVESAGNSGLLLVPFEVHVSEKVAAATIATAVQQATQHGMALCQVVGPVGMSKWDDILRESGLTRLTDLMYVSSTQIPANAEFPIDRVSGLQWVHYSPATEKLFCEAIALSYVQSQDCPELIGVRSAEEALPAHRAAGEFDPGMWVVVAEGQTPLGVLLLNKVRREALIEIVYMGVSQPARGSGVANRLMSQACQMAMQKRCRLILAMDARNERARRFYARWKFVEVARRAAWIANFHGVES